MNGNRGGSVRRTGLVQGISWAAPVVVLTVAVALLARGELFSASPFVAVAQVAAFALAVWARVSLRNGAFRVAAAPAGRTLVTRGPYRRVRHPMYAAALLLIATGVLAHPSWINAVLLAAVAGVVALRIHEEERLLRERYPEYAEYAHRTRRIVPFLF